MEATSNKQGCWVRDKAGNLYFISNSPPDKNYKPLPAPPRNRNSALDPSLCSAPPAVGKNDELGGIWSQKQASGGSYDRSGIWHQVLYPDTNRSGQFVMTDQYGQVTGRLFAFTRQDASHWGFYWPGIGSGCKVSKVGPGIFLCDEHSLIHQFETKGEALGLTILGTEGVLACRIAESDGRDDPAGVWSYKIEGESDGEITVVKKTNGYKILRWHFGESCGVDARQNAETPQFATHNCQPKQQDEDVSKLPDVVKSPNGVYSLSRGNDGTQFLIVMGNKLVITASNGMLLPWVYTRTGAIPEPNTAAPSLWDRLMNIFGGSKK